MVEMMEHGEKVFSPDSRFQSSEKYYCYIPLRGFQTWFECRKAPGRRRLSQELLFSFVKSLRRMKFHHLPWLAVASSGGDLVS